MSQSICVAPVRHIGIIFSVSPCLDSDGCSSHVTSVAVGTLGGYLTYYLTEQDITKRPLS